MARHKLSKLEKMRKKIKAPKHTHRPKGDEIYEIFTEGSRPCGYLRNFYINAKHTKIYGRCVLNRRACKYNNLNAMVFNCEVYNKYFGVKEYKDLNS